MGHCNFSLYSSGISDFVDLGASSSVNNPTIEQTAASAVTEHPITFNYSARGDKPSNLHHSDHETKNAKKEKRKLKNVPSKCFA